MGISRQIWQFAKFDTTPLILFKTPKWLPFPKCNIVGLDSIKLVSSIHLVNQPELKIMCSFMWVFTVYHGLLSPFYVGFMV